MAIGQGPIKKPGTPPKDAKRLIGDALVGQVRAELSGNSAVGAQNRAQVANAARAVGRVPQAMASGLNQANPGAPTTPLRSPSEVAGGLAAGVQGAGGAVGGVMASGLNQVNPNAPVTSRGANDLAGAMLQHGAQNSIAAGQGPANVRPSTGIGANFGANLQGRLDGTIGSRASGGTPPPPSGLIGPAPARATNGRPDFPQLGGLSENPTAAPMGGGMQIPSAVQPQPLTPPVPRPDFPQLSQAPYSAPSGASMVPGPAYPAPPAPAPTSTPQVAPAPQPPADGRVQAVNPQLSGLAAGINAMRDQNAAIAARPQGPSYIQRQLAEQGIPQQSANGSTPLPFEKGPAPKAQPLGGFAKNDTDFGSRMVGENRYGNFGGTLPVKGPDGKVTFADGPMKDFGMKPSGQFETDANGRTTKKGGYSSMELQAQADAKATFDNRRGGLEARKAAYEARNAPGARAMQARDNPTPRQINSQERAQARSENRRYRQGKLTMGERLAFADPESASRTALGKAQIDANNQRAGSQDQFRLAQLQQQEQNNIRNNQTARENSQDRLQGQYAAGGMAPPAKPGEAPAPAKPATPGDVKLMPKADGYATLREQHGAEAANRMMNEIHGTRDWNYEQYPNGPTILNDIGNWLFSGGEQGNAPQTPPAGSPNRARAGGGMQLPNQGRPANKPRGSLVSGLREPK